MKKVLFIIVAISLIIPTSLYAEKKKFGKGLFWEVKDESTLVISGQGAMPDYPDFKKRKAPWAKITTLKTIIIEEGITHIGDNAFYEGINIDYKCYIRKVTLPTTLKSIGKYGLAGLNFESIELPKGLKNIFGNAFYYCTYLKKIIIPNSVEYIGGESFMGNHSLEEIVLPSKLESIGYECFEYCKALKKITFSGNIKDIGRNAFIKDGYHEEYFDGKLYNAPAKLKNNPSYYGISPSATFLDDVRDDTGHTIFEAKAGRNVSKCDGYYHVNDNGVIGITDLSGNWIVPISANYKSIDERTSVDGRKHYIVSKEGKRGVMNEKFRLMFLLPCSSINELTTNLWMFKDNGYMGVINSKGQIIIPTTRRYTAIGPSLDDDNALIFAQDGYTGKCDLQGREISKYITEDGIKSKYGYSSMTSFDGVSPKRYKVKKDGYYGVADADGNTIVQPEMDEILSMGSNLLKFRIGSFWGVMNVNGKTLVPTSRGYTSIGRYIVSQKTFSYTKEDGKGECNSMGQQISFIKDRTATNVASNSTTTNGGTNSSSTQSSGGTQRVVVEHQHTLQPVQEWNPCLYCGGTGLCTDCQGQGKRWYGNSYEICVICHGNMYCQQCFGKKGYYTTVYK